MKNELFFTVPDECTTMTANTFLRKVCNISARMLSRLKREENGITKNGKLLKTIDTVSPGDTVVIHLPDDKSKITPVSGELKILYEDRHIIAMDKPHGMPVHPTRNYQTNTLANLVVYHALQKNESYTIRVINRLDKDTSGIVIMAKDKFTAALLPKTTQKAYIAVCEGKIQESGTINKPIRLRSDSKMVRGVFDDGDCAVTHYEPVNTVNGHTILKITLETGRTHQIRCHMSHIGYPLAGDDLYGGSLNRIQRQALHCYKVSFIHPVTNKETVLVSEMPSDMASLCKSMTILDI